MPSLARTQLAPTSLVPNWKQSKDEVLDAGAFTTAGIQFRRLKNGTTGGGTGGRILVSQSATNESETFRPVSGAEMATDAAGDTVVYFFTESFTRFLRLETDADVAGSPVISCEIILK